MLSFTNGHGTGSVRCVDHKCNNCIKDTADDPAIASLLSRVRNEIRFIRASPDRRKVFRDIQWERLRPQNDEAEDDRAAVDEERDEQDAAEAAEANDFLPRSPGAYRRSRAKALEKQKRPWILILDCPTRWSSTFFMVERYVQLFEDLLLFQLRGGFNEYDQETYGPPVSYDEYLLLTSWADALAPVADFIRIAEGEKYPTMGWVCPLFKHVLDCINPQNEPMVLEQEKHFRKVLERSLQKRLGFLLKKPNIALATSALHPAFARLHFVSRQLRDDVWEELEKVAREYGEMDSPHSDDSSSESDVEQGSPNPMEQIRVPSYHTDQGRQLLRSLRKSLTKCTRSSVSLSETLTYAATNKLFDPLDWWRRVSESQSYGLVVHLAKILFCTPATSAPSERIFSGKSVYALLYCLFFAQSSYIRGSFSCF